MSLLKYFPTTGKSLTCFKPEATANRGEVNVDLVNRGVRWQKVKGELASYRYTIVSLRL